MRHPVGFMFAALGLAVLGCSQYVGAQSHTPTPVPYWKLPPPEWVTGDPSRRSGSSPRFTPTSTPRRKSPADQLSGIMDSWVSSPVWELIESWGAPTSVVPDGRGGMIYVYRYRVDGLLVPLGPMDLTVPYPEPPAYLDMGYERVREFYVNRYGIIYSWRWQGL